MRVNTKDLVIILAVIAFFSIGLTFLNTVYLGNFTVTETEEDETIEVEYSE